MIENNLNELLILKLRYMEKIWEKKRLKFQILIRSLFRNGNGQGEKKDMCQQTIEKMAATPLNFPHKLISPPLIKF